MHIQFMQRCLDLAQKGMGNVSPNPMVGAILVHNNKIIGEADPRNTFWGIGTSISTELSKDPSKWKGQNQLGKILMTLRSEFKQ